MELMSLDAWVDLSEGEQQQLLFRATDRQGIVDAPTLRTNLVNLVHLTSLDGAATRLDSLNRRFNGLCFILHIGRFRDVMGPLVGPVLRQRIQDGRNLYTTNQFWNDWTAELNTAFNYIDDLDERGRMIDETVEKFYSKAR
jgi:hypothetical protein